MQVFQQQVVRNQAGAEIHGEHEEESKERAALQALLGERIGGAGAGDHAQQREDQNHPYTEGEGTDERTILEDGCICIKVDALRPEHNRLLHDGCIAGDGLGCQMNEGKNACQAQDGENQHDEQIADAEFSNRVGTVADGIEFLLFFFCHDAHLLTADRLRQEPWRSGQRSGPASDRPGTGRDPQPWPWRTCWRRDLFHKCRWRADTGNP